MSKLGFILLLAVALSGCAGSFEEARVAGIERVRASSNPPGRDVVRCGQLDARRGTWGSVAASSIVLSGASGLTTIPVDDPSARTALVAGAVAFAAVAAGAKVLGDSAATSWARECAGAGE